MIYIQAYQTHFQMKVLARRVVLKQRNNVARQWPISCVFSPVADKCRRILFNEPIQHKALTGRLIRSIESLDLGSCQEKCYNEPNCVSINVGPLDGGRHKCELNNATVEASSFLQTRMDYTFLGIEVRYMIARVKKKSNTLHTPLPPRDCDSKKCGSLRKGINHK